MKKAKEVFKALVVRCPECDRIFAAAKEPGCYQDAEWMRNLRNYSAKGLKIEMVEFGRVSTEWCDCMEKRARKKADDQPSLFPEQ